MPRIRTLKPEFWTHPVIGKQDDATRLMAIALLNYADDEGYFHAEPNLVRGFCRSFDDDSMITRRCLDTLIKIGYITVYDNAEYGLIGHIEKFSIHQRIDRPTPSKIKQYYSKSPRRALDEPLMPEQGTGNKETYNSVVKNVIEFLNQKTGKAFRTTTDKTKTLIMARIKEGYTEGDCMKVIETKSAQWSGTDSDKFLRPETLFGVKFEGYLNERSTNGKKPQIQNLTNANDVK